jgi:hypothetical protein
MLEIKLTGKEAEEYLNYLNSRNLKENKEVKTEISILPSKPFKQTKAVEDKQLLEELQGSSNVSTSKNKAWTVIEDNQIHYAAKEGKASEQSVSRLAKKIGRTESAIRSRAIKLGYRIKHGRVVQ